MPLPLLTGFLDSPERSVPSFYRHTPKERKLWNAIPRIKWGGDRAVGRERSVVTNH